MNSRSLLLRARSVRCFALLTPIFAAAAVALQAQPATGVTLPAPARGTAAIDALGAHLPEVAKAYGLDASRLNLLLRTQPALGVDQAGSLFFVCEGPDAQPGHGAKNADATVEESLVENRSSLPLLTPMAAQPHSVHRNGRSFWEFGNVCQRIMRRSQSMSRRRILGRRRSSRTACAW